MSDVSGDFNQLLLTLLSGMCPLGMWTVVLTTASAGARGDTERWRQTGLLGHGQVPFSQQPIAGSQPSVHSFHLGHQWSEQSSQGHVKEALSSFHLQGHSQSLWVLDTFCFTYLALSIRLLMLVIFDLPLYLCDYNLTKDMNHILSSHQSLFQSPWSFVHVVFLHTTFSECSSNLHLILYPPTDRW